jgi:signal transduction histidine kinase
VRRDPAQLLDAAVLVFAGVIVVVGVALRADASTRPLALALAVAAAATLVLRRSAPTVTLAISGALVLALFALDHAAGAVAVIAPAIALYSLALSRGRIHLVAAVVAVAAAVIVADVFLVGRHGHGLTLQTASHVALVAVPVLAAEALRNRRSYIQLLLERLELAERTREEEAQRRAEQERLRIARDLHDVVAHTLTTINVQAGVAAHLADREPARSGPALAAIEAASRDALDELRAILGVLREPDGTEVPLEPAPGLTSLSALVDRFREAGSDIELEIENEQPRRVPEAVQLAAYRIVQESLTNAARHAPGAGARVRVAYDADRLRLEIQNGLAPVRNGNGREPGAGIVGMRERAVALGGTLAAGPSANLFRVEAELPYTRCP